MALGTDAGGSTRLPACWCGIVGLKPTFGLVPITGTIPMDTFLDHVCPMTRTVYDCALMLEVSRPRLYATIYTVSQKNISDIFDCNLSGMLF